MNKMQRAILGPHSVCMQGLMILQNLFCRAAPFIVLSSRFAQRSLYEAHTKGCGLAQALHGTRWKRRVSERESVRMTCKA